MPIVSAKSTATEFIGCGAYRLDAQERGTSIELVANDKYFKPGLPRIARIRFVVYADENLRVAALQSGDVDMIEYVPWQSHGGGRAAIARLKMDTQYGPFMDVLFNGTKGPFSDARVRRAVAHAVRREDIVQAAFFGRGKVLEGVPIVEGTPFWDAELSRGWRYDVAEAKTPARGRRRAERLPDRACSRARSSACTRTPPRSCSSISPRSASSAS